MKKLLISALVILAAFGCQNKEDSKPQYQFPSGGSPMQQGGPVQQAGPIQGHDDTAMLKEILGKDPKNVEAWIRLGNISMDASRFPEAVEAYQKALEIDPQNVDVRVDLGTCYRGIRKSDLAVREYKKALEIKPNHVNAHKNLGVVLVFDMRDVKQGVAELEKALQLAPGAPDAEQLRQEIQKIKAAK